MPENNPTPPPREVRKITQIYTEPRKKMFLKVLRMPSKKATKKIKIAMAQG